MAITEAFSGTATVGTTAWSMTTGTAGPDLETADGVYQAFVELNALLAGDVYEWLLYEKVIAGSTQRLVTSAAFAGVQGMPVWASPSFILLHGWDMTLVKISGVDRAINWSIRKVA